MQVKAWTMAKCVAAVLPGPSDSWFLAHHCSLCHMVGQWGDLKAKVIHPPAAPTHAVNATFQLTHCHYTSHRGHMSISNYCREGGISTATVEHIIPATPATNSTEYELCLLEVERTLKGSSVFNVNTVTWQTNASHKLNKANYIWSSVTNKPRYHHVLDLQHDNATYWTKKQQLFALSVDNNRRNLH